MKIRLLLIGLLLISCDIDPTRSLKKKIEGKWKLTKVVTTARTFAKPGGYQEYEFKNDGTYAFSGYLNDIMEERKGYYEIKDEYYRKSGFFLILKGKVEPNSYGDTIREHSMFEILTLTQDSLVVGTQMQYLYDSFPNQWFNRKEFYTGVN